MKPSETAFRVLATGEVILSGPIHDLNVLPAFMIGNPTRYVEDGFIDQDGSFLTRKQAAIKYGSGESSRLGVGPKVGVLAMEAVREWVDVFLAEDDLEPGWKLMMLPLSDVRRWQDVDPDNLEYMRKLVRDGVTLPPIKVVRDSQGLAKYVIRDGSHRYRAFELEGKTEIPAIVMV